MFQLFNILVMFRYGCTHLIQKYVRELYKHLVSLRNKKTKKQIYFFFFPMLHDLHLFGINKCANPPTTNKTAIQLSHPSIPCHIGQTKPFRSNRTPTTSFLVPMHFVHICPPIFCNTSTLFGEIKK